MHPGLKLQQDVDIQPIESPADPPDRDPVMIQQINIHEAKTQLSRLIERSLSGEEFIIAKAGKPVARLTPIKPARQPRRLGLLDGELQIPDDFNAPLPEALLNAFEGRG